MLLIQILACTLQDAQGSDGYVEHALNLVYLLKSSCNMLLNYCRTPRAATSMWSCPPASRSC